LSPDGKRLLTGVTDGVVRCWDTDAGKVAWSVKFGGDAGCKVRFAADGKTVLTWVEDLEHTRLSLWDAKTGKPAAAPKPPADDQFRTQRVGAWLPDAGPAPDGHTLLLRPPKKFALWDTTRGKAVHSYPGQTRGFTLARDGKSVFVLSATLRRLDLTSGRAL